MAHILLAQVRSRLGQDTQKFLHPVIIALANCYILPHTIFDQFGRVTDDDGLESDARWSHRFRVFTLIRDRFSTHHVDADAGESDISFASRASEITEEQADTCADESQNRVCRHQVECADARWPQLAEDGFDIFDSVLPG